MKNKNKKWLCLATATTMALSLVACSSDGSGSGGSSGSTSNQATEDLINAADKENLPVAQDEIIKIGDGTVEFSLFQSIHAVTAEEHKSQNDHPGAALWEEATGVKVNYINPPVGEESTNLNLMINDLKSMPDVFFIGNFDSIYPGGTMMAIEDGVILNITELVEMYAPNFMAMINSDENLRKDVYNDDGVLVGFGTIVVNEDRREGSMRGPIINQDYLDAAGLDIPVTIADWDEMLRAFQDLGVKYPFSFQTAFLKDCFSSAYGVPHWAEYYADQWDGGTVKYGPAEEGFKEYLTLMNGWYADGLIDPDCFTRKLVGDIQTDVVNGNVGSFVDYITQFKQLPTNAQAQGFDELNLVGAPYPVLNEGDELFLRDFEGNRTNVAAYITTNAEDPISVIQWIDQLYCREGRDINTFGEVGVTFEIEEDGTRVYTDYITNNPDGLSQTQAGRYYIFKDMFRTWEDDDHALLYTEDSQHAAWEQWDTYSADGEIPLFMTLTAEESDEYVVLKSEIDTYAEEMRQKFIMGTADIEADWDNYIATLEGMGLARAIEIQQEAYTRYTNR
ncbi:MAG: extracellular solute-binding protein [Eubacteriales bacterium]